MAWEWWRRSHRYGRRVKRPVSLRKRVVVAPTTRDQKARVLADRQHRPLVAAAGNAYIPVVRDRYYDPYLNRPTLEIRARGSVPAKERNGGPARGAGSNEREGAMASHTAGFTRGPRASIRGHAWVDERSRALHAAVADHLRRDPALRQRALANIARWEAIADPRTLGALRTWRRLLAEQPLDVLLAMLVDDSEHAAELRQSSPFAGILPAEDRFAIFHLFETL